MQAMRYVTKVERGKVVLPRLRLKSGTPVEVIVLVGGNEEFEDLAAAAQTSLDFWDNPIDDQVWNDA